MTHRTRECSIDGCGSVEKARGWCTKHWKRWRRHGNPTAPVKMKARSAEESFECRTEEQGDCLIWTGDTTEDGYGIIVSNGRRVRAHRYAWEREYGAIPAGIQIDIDASIAHAYSPRTFARRRTNRTTSIGPAQPEIRSRGSAEFAGTRKDRPGRQS